MTLDNTMFNALKCPRFVSRLWINKPGASDRIDISFYVRRVTMFENSGMKHAGERLRAKRKRRSEKQIPRWMVANDGISRARRDSSLYLSNSQTDEQPLKYLQITGLPKDVFPLASKTKGNPDLENQSIWDTEILIDAKQPPSIIVTSFRYAFDKRNHTPL